MSYAVQAKNECIRNGKNVRMGEAYSPLYQSIFAVNKLCSPFLLMELLMADLIKDLLKGLWIRTQSYHQVLAILRMYIPCPDGKSPFFWS